MKPYDIVELAQDLPEHNLRKGQQGAVLLVYRDPSLAYEIEFANEKGETLALLALKPELLRKIADA